MKFFANFMDPFFNTMQLQKHTRNPIQIALEKLCFFDGSFKIQ